MRRTDVFLGLLLSGIAWNVAAAQNVRAAATKPDDHYYKLIFRVIQVGNEKTAPVSHTYSEMVRTTDDSSQIRANVQFQRKFTGDDGKILTVPYDVGTSIDVLHLSDVEGSLRLRVVADIQQLPAGALKDGMLTGFPVTRQSKWDSNVIVPIGKPTIIFASDEVNGDGKSELELTATQIR